MADEQPTTTNEQPDGNTDDAVRVEAPQGHRVRESTFTDQVIDTAHHHGWQSFHLRDRDSIHIVRGRGFPDLVMYRKDEDTGRVELIAAELKRGYDSELRPEQSEWLDALRQHIPAYEWRPEDWDEIESTLEQGPGSLEESAPRREHRWSGSQIPASFGNVITNLAETIEAEEFGTGNRARLRRMDSDNPDSAVFWQLMVRDGMPRNPDIAKWGLITHGIALMAHGSGKAHVPGMCVGRSLYLGGEQHPGTRGFYGEDRLSTLLAARGPAFHSLLARLFRMLGNEGCAFNWREMAWFILNEGYNEAEVEKSRIEVAREYYRAAAGGSQQSEAQGE